jgi:hypothetical protein
MCRVSVTFARSLLSVLALVGLTRLAAATCAERSTPPVVTADVVEELAKQLDASDAKGLRAMSALSETALSNSALTNQSKEKARCVRYWALALAWRWDKSDPGRAARCATPLKDHLPQAALDYPSQFNYKELKLTIPADVAHVAIGDDSVYFATNPAKPGGEVITLFRKPGKYEITYEVACPSSSHGVKAVTLGDAGAELNLGFAVVVPPALAKRTLTIDGQPLTVSYTAADVKHVVMLDGRSECSIEISAQAPTIKFPEACMAAEADPPPNPTVKDPVSSLGWGAALRVDLTQSGVGNLTAAGTLSYSLAPAVSIDLQAGGLFSRTASGPLIGLGARFGDAFQVAPMFEVFGVSIDGAASERAWVWGIHPNLQVRARLYKGLGAFVAPGWFVILDEGVRNNSDASYWSLGLGADWRSQ